jgi:UPF0755 protein
MYSFFTKKMIAGSAVLLCCVLAAGFFLYGLFPVNATAAPVVFEIKQGEGFRAVVAALGDAGLVRSPFVTETLSLLTGSALHLQPGLYKVSAAMSPNAILGKFSADGGGAVSVTIPEGENIYQIDAILADALVIPRGALIAANVNGALEGRLFPDTYQFYTNTSIHDVVKKMTDDFEAKAAPLLAGDAANATSDLIMASIVEKEVPDLADQKMVAGILWKRLKAGMLLQVDASVCYAMQMANLVGSPDCGVLDLKIDSPYNAYLYRGLPPGPIGNPGISAIQAAVDPVSSPYWFYLSDPKTGKTIFAKTLDEQHQNTVKYLDSE